MKTSLRLISILPCLVILFVFHGHVFAAEGGIEVLDKKRVDAAVKKGVEWLKSQQKPDGSWTGTQQVEAIYPYGTTALCLLAVLKGGEPKDSECVKKALNYLRTNQFSSTYGTSCLILALAALVEDGVDETPDKDGDGMRTSPVEDPEKGGAKRFRKMPSWLRKLMTQAVNHLIKIKSDQVWRYPGTTVGEAGQKLSAETSGNNDASNTQYVMMALFAARRVGIKVPTGIFAQVAEYFITNQEADGPEVKPSFHVPGADLKLSDVKDMEKKWAKEFNRQLKEAEREARKEGKEFEGIDGTTVPRENPYDKFGGELPKFFARGWSYLPNEYRNKQGMPADWINPTGSMTCSGVIACMLCKVYLENTSWDRKHGDKLKKAIRDGLAWIVKNWTTSKNPGTAGRGDPWRYYYFYAIERAAVLSLCQLLGGHNWHKEIGEIILDEQNADGSWPGVTGGQMAHGPNWNTCFAILFLKKATTPIIRPETIYSGEGILGGGKKKEKKGK